MLGSVKAGMVIRERAAMLPVHVRMDSIVRKLGDGPESQPAPMRPVACAMRSERDDEAMMKICEFERWIKFLTIDELFGILRRQVRWK